MLFYCVLFSFLLILSGITLFSYISEGELIYLKYLDFRPNIYSPNFKLISNQQSVDSLKDMGIKVIPWTVNEEEDIKKQIELQVDGIITDYPERVIIQCKSRTQQN